MKIQFSLGLILAALAFASCDDTTDDIGTSLNANIDGVVVSTDSFNVATKSILADSVLSNNTTGYLGKVRDPETGAYITSDFMAQFYCLENYDFPEKDSLVAYDSDGNPQYGVVKADSCIVRLYYDDFYGDSLQTMKMTVYEMGKAMNESRNYYSNFDPLAEGYVRTDGLKQDHVYSLTNFNLAQNIRDSSAYVPYIQINLNDEYTDADGNTYNNIGTYIMQKYYDDASNFKDAYAFRNKVLPGLFFKSKSGLGSMAYISLSQINVYFHFLYNDSIVAGGETFWGTEEVLQCNTVTNDDNTLAKLVADTTCTYLKTPAGIFTEMTLPIDEIVEGHESDTITSAKIIIPRLNNETSSEYALSVPKNVLMIPKDSLYSFFENDQIQNNKNSFITSWGYSTSSNSGENNYTFSNISGMITSMKNCDRSSADWNKVVLVPVSVATSSYSYSGQQVSSTTNVTNDMSLSSTKLVKGTSTDSPIKISIIYSRFK
jgi:hypothetical protein